MTMPNSRDQTEFAELSKQTNIQEVSDIQNYNVEQIEAAIKHGRSIKSAGRKLGIGQGKMYVLKDKQSHIISNFDDIVKAAEQFCTDRNNPQSRHASFIRSSNEEDTEALCITSDEVKLALQAMTHRKKQDKME